MVSSYTGKVILLANSIFPIIGSILFFFRQDASSAIPVKFRLHLPRTFRERL